MLALVMHSAGTQCTLCPEYLPLLETFSESSHHIMLPLADDLLVLLESLI